MSEEDSQQHSTNPEKRRPLGTVRRWAFLAIGIALLGVLAFLQTKHSELDEKLNTAKSEHEELLKLHSQTQIQLDDLEQKIKTLSIQREHIGYIYRNFREIEDFVPNRSPFIVTANPPSPETNSVVNLSLPEGKHVLAFRMKRMDPKTKEVQEDVKLDFPLNGPAGYRIELELRGEEGAGYRDPRQLLLNIVSTDPDFESVSKELLKSIPRPSGSSSGGVNNSRPFYFPNQLSRSYQASTEEPQGVLINSMGWSGTLPNKESFQLKFAMSVHSEGPISTDPFKYKTRDGHRRVYIGSGMFAFEPNEAE